MNRLRGQKKDVSKLIRAMKTDDIAYEPDLKQNSKSKDMRKSKEFTVLYASNSRKPQQKMLRKNYRYGRTSTEQQSGIYAISRKQNSVQLRSTKMFRVSSKSQQKQSLFMKNPYVSRNSTHSYNSNMPQALKRNPHKRRLLTHDGIRHDSNEKSVNMMVGRDSQEFQRLQINLEEAKDLFARSKFSESQEMVIKFLKRQPQNLDALYLSGANNISMSNYVKSLTALNKLAEFNPLYKQAMYIMASTCYYHMGLPEDALKRISTGLNYFPDSSDITFHKGSLLMKMGLFQEALPLLKQCLRLAKDIYDPLLKLAQCYENLKSYKLAIKLYDQIACLSNVNAKGYKFYFKKAKCLKKMGLFKQYINSMETYMKLSSSNQILNLSEIYYGISYAYYKLKEYSNAIMSIEQVLKEKQKQYNTKALILLTVIYIMQRDFYEAWHTLGRKQHLQIEESELQFYEKFCEGVINLMKRKFDVGLEKLEKLKFLDDDSKQGELKRDIYIMYPLYLSYAYFCEGNMKRCLQQIEKILASNESALAKFKTGVNFNKMLCEGLQSYRKGNTKKAISSFEKSISIYPHKPEGYLYLGLCQAQTYLRNNDDEQIQECNKNLGFCIANLKQLNNNYAASAFYCKSVVSAFLENWDDAMNEIDQAIERSQENQAKMFYQRAQILGCCQNYKQAIHEASVAISLNEDECNYYILRSKCYQIEGDGNKAFADLQTYININPNDTEIHKYAGHLLFQNGAFEDALQAYDNGVISETQQNTDVFLTKAKTHFLLSNLDECIKDMNIAFSFRKNDSGLKYDIQVLKLLKVFFETYQQNGFQFSAAKQKLLDLQALGQDIKYGRIFRKTQIKVLESLFTFYQGDYRTAGRLFHDAIKFKEESFMEVSQEQFEEEEKQKYFFLSLMHFNRAICHLVMKQKVAAITCLKKCRIDPNSKTHEKMSQLIKLVQKQKQQSLKKKQEIKTQKNRQKIVIEIFSQKNKLTKNLRPVEIELDNHILQIKLCVPFPKVQPPQINPKFDVSALKDLNPKIIQRKPEAPWILREQNSIKFTQKIQKFSRLDINNSELSKASNSKRMLGQRIQSSLLDSESMGSLTELKMKLRLDGDIEDKLNRLMQRR